MKKIVLVLFACFYVACDSDVKIKTKGQPLTPCSDNCPEISKIIPLGAIPGEVVALTGINLNRLKKLSVGEHNVTFEIKSNTSASFVMPEGKIGEVAVGTGITPLGLTSSSSPKMYRLSPSADIPMYSGDSSNVCLGSQFYDRFGDLQEGTKDCAFQTTLGLSSDIILEGHEVNGVKGTLAYCTSEGQSGCVIKGDFKSVNTVDLGKRIIQGESVAGIEGEADTTLCSSDGQLDCKTHTSFPAAYAQTLSEKVVIGHVVGGITGSYSPDFPDPANVRSNDTVGGVIGTLSNCSSDGQVNCLANSNYKAASNSVLAATNIKSGVTIGGVTGSYTGAVLVACSSDGQTSCEANTSYPAALVSGAASKILQGQTLAGVSGNITLPPVGIVLTGNSYGISNALSGTLTLPSASNVLSTASNFGDPGSPVTPTYTPDFPAAANVLSSDTTDGNTGLIANCGTAGESACLASATFPAMNLTLADGTTDLTSAGFDTAIRTAANFEFWDSSGNRHLVSGDDDLTVANIKNSVEIHGVTGSVTESPANCSSDGETSCVSTASYPAVNAGALVDTNIKTGVVIGGITGTYGGVGLAPDCNTDGEVGCTTISAFPAIDKNAVGLAAKIRNGEVIASVTGTYSPDFPDVGNVLSSDTVNSVSGTLTLPSGANVRSSEGSFGVGGSGSTASLADCFAGGQSSCVATATYATMDLSSAGVTTDLTSGNFDTIIRTGANFEFWDSSGARYVVVGDPDLVASNIKDSVEVHGVTGSVTESPANCSGANQSGCVATATYATMDLSLADATADLTSGNFDTTIRTGANFEFWDSAGARYVVAGDTDLVASNIKDSVEVHGITGSVTESPANCSGANQTGCVATATYASMDLSLAGATTDLTSGNFDTTIRTGANFEFWDSSGTRYVVTGDTDLVASNIKDSVEVHGVTGSVTESPANCSGANQTGCVATATYATMDLSLADATTDLTSGNFDTTIRTGANFEFWDSSGARYVVTGDTDLVASNIKDSVEVHGITGSVTESPANCSGANQSGCVATSTYATMDLSLADATTDLTSGNFDTTIRTGANFEFWDSSGARYVVAGDTDLIATNVKDSVEIHGITGSVTESPANCSGNGQQGCVTTASYESATPRGTWDLTSSFPGSGYYTGISNAPAASDLKRTVQVAGVTGNFPSSSSPLPRYSSSSSSSTTTAGVDETDLTNFNTQLVTDGTFEYWDSQGVRRTGSGDSDIKATNVMSGIQFENLSITGTGVTLGDPSNFQTIVPVTEQINLSWNAATGASGYLLIFRESAAVTWTPTDGNSYSTGAQGSDTIVYVGSSLSYSHTSLTGGSTYYYALYAYDVNDKYSTVVSTSQVAETICASLSAGTWILVPGDTDYGTSDFCIMKYEAKNVSSAPESNAADTPWVSINQNDAQTECQSIGSGYDLMSNAQFMTVAANVAGIGSNWSSGTVGTGNLYRGHSDNSPSSTCAASTDDSLAYVEGSCTPIGASSGENDEGTQRRTFNLSNGEVIWDLSANVREWTTLQVSTGKATPTSSWPGVEYTTVSSGANLLLSDLIPTNAVKSYWNDTWDKSQEIGGYSGNHASNNLGLGRGGYMGDGNNAGLFEVYFYSPTSTNYWGGFRCVYVAP